MTTHTALLPIVTRCAEVLDGLDLTNETAIVGTEIGPFGRGVLVTIHGPLGYLFVSHGVYPTRWYGSPPQAGAERQIEGATWTGIVSREEWEEFVRHESRLHIECDPCRGTGDTGPDGRRCGDCGGRGYLTREAA